MMIIRPSRPEDAEPIWDILRPTLRAGETYQVPNQPSLSLLTGNAGGLEILVDGEPVPAIGDVGTVRRDVTLEADRLKAGTAVVD